MVGQVADLVFVGMTMKVVYFGFGVGVVDFVEEFVGDDIDITEKIFHRDFSFLEPKVEIEAKVAAKNSSFVGAEYTFGY